MTAWTPQQIQCLDALGIAPMAFVQPELKSGLKPASTPEATAAPTPAASATLNSATPAASATIADEPATDNTTTEPRYFYRIGPWYVSSAQLLPVEGIAWLNDLARYANTRVSQVNDINDALDIDPYVQAPLTPEQKQQLWAQLKARLPRTKPATEATTT